jgi:transglutaminase-like putative cysteine protease
MGGGALTSAWRLKVTHRTQVHYCGPVHASYNEARMTPLTLPRQSAVDTQISTGTRVPIWTYRDYWGAVVSAFDIQAPHDELVIQADATVETRAVPRAGRPLSWATLRERAAAGRLLEFLTPTRRTAVGPELAEAVRLRVAGADPGEAAADIASWVNDRVSYMAGATQVQTGAQEVWDLRRGVCQDMAHLTVALMREAGLPARYVSGYLHPQPDAHPGDEIEGQSHAWVEFWDDDWIACDPTNLSPVGERHVLVAVGRDYGDVPPLKGIYKGPPNGTMQVTVTVTRLA